MKSNGHSVDNQKLNIVVRISIFFFSESKNSYVNSCVETMASAMSINGNDLLVNETNIDKGDHFIKCIFFCKFHATAGPQIVTQVPNNYISKDVFDTISQYMIPKAQLQRCFVSVYVSFKSIRRK